MSWEANKDRCQKVYFGKPFDVEPTKQEVGEFIMNEMGLTYGEGPAWSKGVPRLVRLGMKNWGRVLEENTLSDYATLENEKNRLERKNKILRNKLEDERAENKWEQRADSDRAVDRLEKLEATILEILCRVCAFDGESPDFLSVEEIARQSELEDSTVAHHLEKLSRTAFGGYVEFDKKEGVARVTGENVFEEYCQDARLDPDQVAIA